MVNKDSATPTAYTSCLRVDRIRLAVRLGVGEEERSQPQDVEVDIVYYFPELTEASLRDGADFVCYDKLSYALRDMCEGREFKLIEYLALQMFAIARKAAPQEVKISLKLHKCRILVPFVLGGSSFAYTDLPPFSWTLPV